MGKELNVRQEQFAQLVANGLSATQAYIQAGYKVSEKVAGTNGSRLLENAGVMARIKGLREKAAAKSEFKREHLAAQLIAGITTPVSQVDENSPLAQEMTRTVVTIGTGKNQRVEVRTKVKMVSKDASARLLCDMFGWKEPEQVVVETGPKTLDAIEARARAVVSALDKSKR